MTDEKENLFFYKGVFVRKVDDMGDYSYSLKSEESNLTHPELRKYFRDKGFSRVSLFDQSFGFEARIHAGSELEILARLKSLKKPELIQLVEDYKFPST